MDEGGIASNDTWVLGYELMTLCWHAGGESIPFITSFWHSSGRLRNSAPFTLTLQEGGEVETGGVPFEG